MVIISTNHSEEDRRIHQSERRVGDGESSHSHANNHSHFFGVRTQLLKERKEMALALRALRQIRRLMVFLAQVIVVMTILIIAIALPFMSYDLYQRGREPLILAWYCAGGFAILASLISIHGIVNHLMHYHQPQLQRYIVRILWMVPIYALEAWSSLRFKEYRVYIQILRELYEAFVIYSFMTFLIKYLGEETQLSITLTEKPQHVHIFPFSWCCSQWTMGRQFLFKCKTGTFQYVVVMVVCSILVWILEEAGAYHEGKFDFDTAYTYITIIRNFSQTWALYCLVLFYQATSINLAPVKPLGKFICVKAVVFFSFWQSIALDLLVHEGYIPRHQDWTVENVAQGLQDFLICIEMFIASIAHHFVFPYTEYIAKEMPRESFLRSFIHSTIPVDMYTEMRILNSKFDAEDIDDDGEVEDTFEAELSIDEAEMEQIEKGLDKLEMNDVVEETKSEAVVENVVV